MRMFHLNVLLMLALLVGCDKKSAAPESLEERDPSVLSGQQLAEDGDFAGAIAQFKRAIDETPMIARPHLDLAMTYQKLIVNHQSLGVGVKDHVDHHVNAIYHYGRYLELRPDAEKAEFIAEQRQKVIEALAGFMINSSPDVQRVVSERNQLTTENTRLKQQLQTASQAAAKPPARRVTQTVPKAAAPKPEPAKPEAAQPPAKKATHQIYHVVAGDTLTKLATKFYDDSGKWDLIYEANKDMMRNPGDLKIGQTLVIPAESN